MKHLSPLFIPTVLLFIAQFNTSAQRSSKPSSPKECETTVDWLDTRPNAATNNVTWGVAWPQGSIAPNQTFLLCAQGNAAIPVQSWPLAYWPDGSVKWSAHAASGINGNQGPMTLKAVATKAGNKKWPSQIELTEDATAINVNTGPVQFKIEKQGGTLVGTVTRNNKTVAANGRLVLLSQNGPDNDEQDSIARTSYFGKTTTVKIEQNGPTRAVIRIDGKHTSPNAGKTLLPFTVRLYFYAGSESMKMMHSIVYDADEQRDFIKGIGMRFDVPMGDEPYNRFVRFTADNGGVFAESVQGLTGLRRDAGSDARQAQISGHKADQIEPYVAERLKYVPTFGDYTLHQPSPDGFEITKRTAAGYGWIKSANGNRASGVCYLGGPNGGLAAGIRHFWQSYPSQIDIRKAASPSAEVTLWLWSPASPAMDLRFYHDGMGQNSYREQWDGLEMTYEDYEKGFGTPNGIARTSELQFWFTAQTPANETLVQFAQTVENPPLLTCSNKHLAKCGVFGKTWGARDTADVNLAPFENALDRQFDFYHQQVDQRKWYGFWNYGDVMHSYDADRHVWRYDVGGFAWDNSELSTDLWLWYYYLHSARPDAFRMAEAMTRHTGEVDVHHTGPFAPLGSRHNVQHWGCSAKQLRISTAANRRFLYYLTADERIGDLLDEQIGAYQTLQRINPQRKRASGETHPLASDTAYVGMGFGTDWGAVAAAWFTKWERTGDIATKNRLTASMESIAAQPKGFFTGWGYMNIATGAFALSADTTASASHLNAVFGLFEICAELNEVLPNPKFEKAWLQYCTLYNAPSEQQLKYLGTDLGKMGLRQPHSRLTAYAANKTNDMQLAQRARNEFLGNTKKEAFPSTATINPPTVLNPITEAPGVSTNGAAQWGLSAIQCMHLIKSTLATPAK